MSADLSHAGIDLARTADFTLGGLAVRPSRLQVEGARGAERLQPRVLQALIALAARPGEVVSREVLIDRCWDRRIVGDDAINRCIAKLRQVGGAHGAFSIEAIPKVGYRLIVIDSGADSSTRPRRRVFKPWLLALLAIGAVVVGLAIWRLTPPPLDARTPYVVTPFKTASGDEGSRILAATAASDIAGALRRYQLPTSANSPRRLEIQGLVDGDKAAIHVRVNLVDSRSKVTVWTSEFTSPVGEVDALRTQIAWRVASVAQMANEALEYRSPDFDAESLGLAVKGTDGVENYTWDSLTGPEVLVRRSPKYAPGHNQFAEGLLASSVLGPADQAAPLRARALAEARRAQALRPDFYPTRVTLGWTIDATDWAAKMKLDSDPAPPEAYFWGRLARGVLMLQTGRVAAADLLLGQGIDGHDNLPAVAGMFVNAERLSGRPEQAAAIARQRLTIRPMDQALRSVLLDLMTLGGDVGEARAILEDPARRPAMLSASTLAAYRAYFDWLESGQGSAREAARKAIDAAVWQGRFRTTAVPMLAEMGEIDDAFRVADDFASDPRTRYSAMFFDDTFLFLPETAAMRRDRRFIPLADKLGLLKYWRESGGWPDFCQTEPASVCAAMKAR
jgi:DNA-binding winged helix-turn-helix (wHTH) protein/TolB-like protein